MFFFPMMAIKKVVVAFVFLFPLLSFSQTPSEIHAYIEKYSQVALDQEKEYGIPASITLAQGILESAAGTSQLTVNANNHFGIKALGGWEGPVYLAWDDETEKSRFRKYDSAEESFRDHSFVLKNSPRYSSLFKKSVYDYRAWAIGLQTAGYATASNYAKALIGYIDAYALYAINGGVKLRSGKTVTITTIESTRAEDDCHKNDTVMSEEQEEIDRIESHYVVEINGVRCAILYPGQTLSTLSQKYDISRQKLLEYNEVKSSTDIKEGDVVYLASKKRRYHGIQDYYIVKDGDTLHSISQQFGIRLGSLIRMNRKSSVSTITPGEKLMLK